MKKHYLILLCVVLLAGLAASAWWLCRDEVPAEPDLTLTPYGDTTPLWPTRDSVSLLWGCVNEQGDWVIPAHYDYVNAFSCGFAPCYYQGLPAYLATDGTLHRPSGVTLDETTEFGPFMYGYALVSWAIRDGEGDEDDRTRFALIDTTMHRVLPADYYCMSLMGDNGLIGVQAEEGGPWGYINVQGDWVIQPQFEVAESFYMGYAMVLKDGLCGIIDEQGQFVLDPDFEYVWRVAVDRWAVMTEDGEAIIDVRGNIIVPFGLYDNIFGADDASGLICCHRLEDDLCGWLTRDGEEHGTFGFTLVGPYTGGYALGIDILSRDTFCYHVVDQRGVITYCDTVFGYYDDETHLHNHVLDLRHHLTGYDYAGTLLTLQGDTIHHWVCHQD